MKHSPAVSIFLVIIFRFIGSRTIAGEFVQGNKQEIKIELSLNVTLKHVHKPERYFCACLITYFWDSQFAAAFCHCT